MGNQRGKKAKKITVKGIEKQFNANDSIKLIQEELIEYNDRNAVPECSELSTSSVQCAAVWNNFDLKRPPLTTLPTMDMKFVGRLQSIVQPAIQNWLTADNRRNKKFTETASLLSRLIVRRRNSFRHMAGFHGLCKINAALRRLLRVDLRRELESIDGALPDGIYVGVELPSGNYYEFVLTRILAVYYLHVRIRDLCVVTAEYFVRFMRPNFFLDINVLLLSVLAKLYNFSGVMGNECVGLYDILNAYKEGFSYNANNRVLPVEFEMPSQLNKFVKFEKQKYVKSVEESIIASLVTSSQPAIVTKKPKHTKQQDIGIEIERQIKPVVKSSFSLDNLGTVGNISKFFKTETRDRERSLKTCLTKNLQQHEWLGLQKLFQRKLDINDHKKAIAIVRKFLSNKL